MTELQPIARLSRDLAKVSQTLSDSEARYLVDAYYTVQENRKAADNQVRALRESGEPCSVISWLAEQNRTLENQIKRSLDQYSGNHPVGERMRAARGVGPVIAAGMLAHIDITKAPTVGHIWSYAGLDPSKTWEKGQKRPWNAELKTLCWKLGECFVKAGGDSVYAAVYAERKAYDQQRNERGELADQAARALERKRIGKTTEAFKWYSAGKLPPAQIHERAKRYAVKLFLSHLHEVWYEEHYGVKPARPYAFDQLGHAHYIKPPF